MTEKPPYRHEELYDGVIEELYKNVLPFWLEHSIDKERGGFFSCLDKNGEVNRVCLNPVHSTWQLFSLCVVI